MTYEEAMEAVAKEKVSGTKDFDLVPDTFSGLTTARERGSDIIDLQDFAGQPIRVPPSPTSAPVTDSAKARHTC